MRVLLAHNAYRHEGGEERALRQLQAALEARGHTVQLFQRHSREWDDLSVVGKLTTAAQIPYSFTTKSDLEPHLSSFSPDVIHVHNLFPFLTPSVYDVARQNGIPVVQTLHNYRLFCMNGLLFREGRPCELCVEGGTWHGAVHACYQNSPINSTMMAGTLGLHRIAKTWSRKVDRFIVLSDFSRTMYRRAGFDTSKFTVLPNPVDEKPEPDARGGTTFLYMGRLSEEKGIMTLLKAFHIFSALTPHMVLNIAGDGPLMPSVRQFLQEHPQLPVKVFGFVTGIEKERLLNEARFIVFPSECYENCPYGLLEPLARGIPVVGSRRGAIPEIISEGKTGWLFDAGSVEGLAACLSQAAALSQQDEAVMRRAAWEESHRRFAPDTWVKEIENLYDSIAIAKP